MELSTWESILYGFVSGFFEFLPVSSETHRMLFLKLIGAEEELLLLRFCTHAASLLGIILAMYPLLMKFRRETRLASIPFRRRRRQPDQRLILEIRMVKAAAVPVLISLLFYGQMDVLSDLLWVHTGLLVLNGLVLYLPQFMLRGNKDSRNMSSLDSLLIGLSAALGILPGISRVGCAASVAQMRGADREFAAESAILIGIPALAGLTVIDFLGFLSSPGAASFSVCLLVGVSSFAASIVGVNIIRYFSKKFGLTSFSFYSWGMALLCLILYLTVI